MTASNPFVDLPAGSQQNPDRSFHMSADITAAILAQCPGTFWKLVIGLGRRAGLRVPSEVSQLSEKMILPRAMNGQSNLRTTFTKIITRAGFEP